MQRQHVLLGTLGLIAVLLVPGNSAQAVNGAIDDAPGQLQRGEVNRWVDPSKSVPPDYAYTSDSGSRVEIYSSAGDDAGENVDGDATSDPDWRSVNAYAYLVNSVPKNSQLHTTLYNTLTADDTVKYVPDTTTPAADDGKWALDRAPLYEADKVTPKKNASGDVLYSKVYAPTAAFLHQVNQYDTPKQRKEFIHVLGNKLTVDGSAAAGSSLANLAKKATDYHDCQEDHVKGEGACLTTRTSGENLMHAKYAAFEQARDSEGDLHDNVVWITSANLNGASGSRKSNVSIAVFGDKAAYDGLTKTIYAAEVAQDINYPGFPAAMKNGIAGNTPGFTLFPSPRSKNAAATDTDYEAKLLAASAALGNKTDCRVYAVHSLFSRLAVRQGLVDMQNDDCDVKIVLGVNAIGDVASYYFENAAETRSLIDSVEFGNVHDKTLSVLYSQGGEQVGTTFGGSANFNSTSLQYDELAFRMVNVGLTQAVQRHSERMYLLAKGTGKAVGVTGVKVTPPNPVVAPGKTLKLKASVAPSNASVKTVTWSTKDENAVNPVATVDPDGTVRALRDGTVDVTALSVAGGITDTVTVTVTGAQPGSQPDTSPGANVTVTTAPEMTMDPYQGQPAYNDTDVVITWSQGDVDLTGTAKMQYRSGSSWKTWKTVPVKNGRFEESYAFVASHTWRVVGSTVTAPAVTDTTPDTISGYSQSVVQSKPSSSTMRIYAPTIVPSTTNVPYILSWAHSGTPLVSLQYYTGSKWVTAEQYKMPNNTLKIGYPATNTRKWRVATSGGRSSASVTVATAK